MKQPLKHLLSAVVIAFAAQHVGNVLDMGCRLAARLEQGLDYAAVARRAQCATSAAARTLVGRALARIDALLREDGFDLRHVRPAGRRRQ